MRPAANEFTCGDCALLEPSTEYLSVKDRKPLLGRCKGYRYMVLLSEHRNCVMFRKKE